MNQYPVAVAQAQLPRLIEKALAGEDIIINAGPHMVVSLSPWPPRKARQFGAEAGTFPVDFRFFEPHPRDWALKRHYLD